MYEIFWRVNKSTIANCQQIAAKESSMVGLADIKSCNIILTWREFGCFSMAVGGGICMTSHIQVGDLNQVCFDLTLYFNDQLGH